MEEFVTDAVVLNLRPATTPNRIADLFTKNIGRVEARVVSGLKTGSKLAPHLDPLTLVTVRILQKNQYLITDALSKDRFPAIRKNPIQMQTWLDTIFLIRSFLPPLVPDPELWHELVRSLKRGEAKFTMFLKLLGYDPSLASCSFCDTSTVEAFYVPDQLFVCSSCRKRAPSEQDLINVT